MKLPALFRRGEVEVGPSGELVEKMTDLNAVTPNRPFLAISSPFGWIVEAFGGMWQGNMRLETQNAMAFAAVYACVRLIADDVAKMRVKLMRRAADGVWDEVTKADDRSPFLPVLRKPNDYQTRIQFLTYWMTSLLLWGNAYVLLIRAGNGMVRAMYPLDPRTVTPLVGPDGSVFYQVKKDELNGVTGEQGLVFAARDIIHDRMICPFHPLVGVSPIYAAGTSATQGIRIQANSERFFRNQSRPSGHLTTEAKLTEEQYERIKAQVETSTSGENLGRLLITGGGLKYEPFTMPAEASQLIEQQRWTVEDVCRAFGVPLYKIGAGAAPSLNNLGALNQDYYGQVIQARVESIELLLDEALNLPEKDMGTELDLDTLLRMDPLGRAEVDDKRIKAGTLAPNEARAAWNLHPVEGGEFPLIQQQNYSLPALAKRDAKEDPFASGAPKPAPAPAPDEPEAANDDEISDEDAQAAKALFRKALTA